MTWRGQLNARPLVGAALAVEECLCLQRAGRRGDMLETCPLSQLGGLAGVREQPAQQLAAENQTRIKASYHLCLVKLLVPDGFKRQNSHLFSSPPAPTQREITANGQSERKSIQFLSSDLPGVQMPTPLCPSLSAETSPT